MLKAFIAKFDVQPWDLTHQVGYLSSASPSVCAIFHNSENVNVLGIRIVNPLTYSIPGVIITCAYMLIISFMVLIALESRAFCLCIRSLWSRETNCRVNHDLQKKAWCLERCNNKQPIWLLDFSVVNWGFYMGFEGSMYMMLPG